MRDGQVRVGEHLLVPRFRRESRVEQEACRGDEHGLVADLVGRVHEQVVDGGVAGALALGLLLVRRVADDDVELLAHGQCPSVSMSSTILLALLRGHAGEVADPEVAGLLDPGLALGDAAGDGLDGDAVQDLVVAHLEDLLR